MPTARVSLDLAGSVAAAERLWYDPEQWPAIVDGFARVVRREGRWPETGAIVEWESRPGGRGRVTERSTAHETGTGQTVAVEDDQLSGKQTVSFAPLEDGVEVALELSYELKGAGPLRRLVDVLFIRRALGDSLRRTLSRLGQELAAEREALL
jgi:hypothetical protein